MELAGVLGAKARVVGELVSDSDLRFDGQLEGSLVVDGELVMGADGYVNGIVIGTKTQVAGRITGEIFIKGQLELMAGARIEGNIYALHVAIHEGAILEGNCVIGEKSADKVKEAQKSVQRKKS